MRKICVCVSCCVLGQIVRTRIRGEGFNGVKRLVVVGDCLEILSARAADRSSRIEHVQITEASGFIAFVRCLERALRAG